MALTGKTIGQLTYLSGVTTDTLFPIELSGDTYHITLQDLIESSPFGTMYQDWIPDVTNTYSIGSSGFTIQSIHVGAGTVFIGPNGALGIDDSGVLFSLNGFATNFFVLGAVTESGVTTTSGVTFNVVGDEVIMEPVSGQTYNLNLQLIPTGGTVNQVLTQTGNSLYEYGWVDFTGGTSGSSGSSGTSGNDGTSGSSGSSGTSGSDGTSGSSGSSGTSGNDGTSGSSGSSGTSGTSPTGTTRYYGAFYDGGTQSLLASNTPQVMSADTTTLSNGVVLSADTKFVVLNPGVYNLQFSAQLNKTSSGTDEVAIWFRKNGIDITESNTEMQVAKQGSTGKLVAAWNYVDQLNANDYFEIAWASADTTYELLYQPSQVSPYAKPSTPSIIVTLTQV